MLTSFFRPSSVAVVGVSEDANKVGSLLFHNILESGFPGAVYLVNPKHTELFGRPCYPTLTEIPGKVELAILVIPAPAVPAVVRDAGAKGIRAVMVISAGFKERGEEGKRLEEEMLSLAASYGIRILGPNCLGVISPEDKFNASFAASMPLPGNCAFFSQSGAYGTALLDLALPTNLGFSHFVSMGNKADVGELELLEAFLADKRVKVIAAYLEDITYGRAFLDTLLKAKERKPLVILKAGETADAERAVLSHTGALAGSFRTYQAAFDKAGVVKAQSLQDLVHLMRAFSWSPLPKGKRVGIITNAGGPGIVAIDLLVRYGLELVTLSPATQETLARALPPEASVENPIDLLGDASADRFRLAIHALDVDARVDALLVIITPQLITQIEETTKMILHAMQAYQKPILPVFLGEKYMAPAISRLYDHRCLAFKEIEEAVRVLAALVHYSTFQPYEPPTWVKTYVQKGRHREALAPYRGEGRALPEEWVEKLCAEVGIPLPKQKVCTSEEMAIAYAKSLFPVVIKAPNRALAHKTDIGALFLNLHNEQGVRSAFSQISKLLQEHAPGQPPSLLVQEQIEAEGQLLIGVDRDGGSGVYEPRAKGFGHLLVFGQGGIYTEIYRDVGYALVPASPKEIEAAFSQTHIYQIMKGARGRQPLAYNAYLDVITAVERLVLLYPEISSLDINPLLVTPTRALAVDIKIFL